ncbi:ATPase, T2SS/T4P/T4SS family [Paenibacillus pasadenensis]
MVTLVNRQLVDRYKEKIERKHYAMLLKRVESLVNEFSLYLPGVQQSRLVEMIVDSITGYGILHPFIADRAVTNIEIESPSDIYVMRNQKWKRELVSFESVKSLEEYIYRLFNRLGGRFTTDSPLGKVEDEEWNLRIRAAGFDLRPDSASLSIRKLRKDVLSEREIRYAMSPHVEEFLRFAMQAGFTVGVVGPFGSGKTTVLGTLLSWIPADKHVGLIQSANEIQRVHPMMRRGLTREIVGEQGKRIDEMRLLDFAKQENYQVLALGEFLDEAALTMLHILQIGIHALFTYHANDPKGAIHSFVFMMMRAGQGYDVHYLVDELARNMDLVIVMDRLRVKEIAQFTGKVDNQMNPVYETLYSFDVEEESRHELLGSWKREEKHKLCDKLRMKALMSGVRLPTGLSL